MKYCNNYTVKYIFYGINIQLDWFSFTVLLDPPPTKFPHSTQTWITCKNKFAIWPKSIVREFGGGPGGAQEI